MSGSSPVSTVYMCYGSVRGEAEVPAKVRKTPASGGWMKLTACSLAAGINYGQRFAMQVEGGGDVTPVQVSKLTDASSTGLLREALLGDATKNAVITFLRTGTHGAQEYMRIELEGCAIVAFGIDGGAEDRAVESYSINYGKMSVLSWSYSDSGQAMGQALAMIENTH